MRLAVVYRHLGLLVVVQAGFKLFALVSRDIVL